MRNADELVSSSARPSPNSGSWSMNRLMAANSQSGLPKLAGKRPVSNSAAPTAARIPPSTIRADQGGSSAKLAFEDWGTGSIGGSKHKAITGEPMKPVRLGPDCV